MKSVHVLVFMLLASCLMSLAWLGHLRYRLNVAATRYGYGTQL